MVYLNRSAKWRPGMTDSADSKKMVGGYGSDDKVEMETGEEIVDNTNEAGDSQIPGVLVDVPATSSNRDQGEPSGPAGSMELGSDATDYTSGGGTSGFGKGS